jgi:hypothetical protein
MTISSGDTFQTSSDIPAQADGTNVYYIIEATDDEGETTTSSQQSYTVSDVTIAINEIHADPDPIAGDANGDGTISTSQDEFVEIVNHSGEAVDISFYTLSDGLSIRHEFPKGSILQPQDAIVVFGGGTPVGFDFYDVQTASSGSLGLNNGGDDIVLKDSSGAVIVAVTYGSEAGNNQSLTRDPDFTGDFVIHTNALGSGGALFSPHQFIMGDWFKPVTVWNGSQANHNWDDSANWYDDVPDANYRVVLPDSLTYYPELSGPGAECNSILIEPNVAIMGINHLAVEGFVSIQQNIDPYDTDNDGFHFLSSPVNGYVISGSPFEPVHGADDFYVWDESSNIWQNYFGGNFPDTEFGTGKAYLVAYAAQNAGFFYGDLNTTSITKNLSFHPSQGNGWNLLGNPYAAIIDWDLITKTADVDGSVYVLRGSDNTYLSWNGSTGGLTDGLIPVCNGFFVKAGATGQSVTIEPEDQAAGNTVFLKRSVNPRPENTLVINISEGDYSNSTYIQFREDATSGFDPLIDAYKLFGSTDKPQLYTRSSGIDYSINCLPVSNTSVELPLGFTGSADSSLIIYLEDDISSMNSRPDVYLQDKVAGKLTDLTQMDYSFLPSGEEDEERFILHFNYAAAAGEIQSREFANVYYASGSVYIRFHSLPTDPVEIKILNVMGQQFLSDYQENSAMCKINLNQPAGIYFVVIKTGRHHQTSKILTH